LFSSPISCMYGLCMDQPLTTLSLSLLDPRLCNCNTPLISPPLQPDTGQQEARGSLKEELCCCCRCFVSNVNVCLCVSEAARVCLGDHKRLFSPLDCSLWTVKEGETRERERDQKPTNLVASRANREDKEAGEQGLSLCSFHHCSEVTGGLARPC